MPRCQWDGISVLLPQVLTADAQSGVTCKRRYNASTSDLEGIASGPGNGAGG